MTKFFKFIGFFNIYVFVFFFAISILGKKNFRVNYLFWFLIYINWVSQISCRGENEKHRNDDENSFWEIGKKELEPVFIGIWICHSIQNVWLKSLNYYWTRSLRISIQNTCWQQYIVKYFQFFWHFWNQIWQEITTHTERNFVR